MGVDEESEAQLAFLSEARVRDEEKFWFTWCTSFEEDEPKLPESIFARSEAQKLPEPSSEDIRPFERMVSCCKTAVLSTLPGFDRLSLSAPALTGNPASSLGIEALRAFMPWKHLSSSAIASICPSECARPSIVDPRSYFRVKCRRTPVAPSTPSPAFSRLGSTGAWFGRTLLRVFVHRTIAGLPTSSGIDCFSSSAPTGTAGLDWSLGAIVPCLFAA
jgi:hypothetical protein